MLSAQGPVEALSRLKPGLDKPQAQPEYLSDNPLLQAIQLETEGNFGLHVSHDVSQLSACLLLQPTSLPGSPGCTCLCCELLRVKRTFSS